jgi:hypothetical protein
MDLNVKLWGLKYNYRKVCRCFCKIPGLAEFSEFLIYFSTKKSVNRVHGLVDQVHGSWLTSPPSALNVSHWPSDQR